MQLVKTKKEFKTWVKKQGLETPNLLSTVSFPCYATVETYQVNIYTTAILGDLMLELAKVKNETVRKKNKEVDKQDLQDGCLIRQNMRSEKEQKKFLKKLAKKSKKSKKSKNS